MKSILIKVPVGLINYDTPPHNRAPSNFGPIRFLTIFYETQRTMRIKKMNRDKFINSESSRFKLNGEMLGLIEKMNIRINDRSQHKKVKIFVCSGQGLTLASTSSTKRITMTPKQFETCTDLIIREIRGMCDLSVEDTVIKEGFNNLEIYIASGEASNIFWDSSEPNVKVQGNVITLSGRISGEYNGVYRESLPLEAHIVVPNGESGFTELSECVVTLGGNHSRSNMGPMSESTIAVEVYRPMIRNSIKKHYDSMLDVSQELLSILSSKNQIKINSDYNPKEMRVGDLYDAYSYITHFIANVSITNSSEIYKTMMVNFSIYKKVLKYHSAMTPHFEKINQKLGQLVNEDRVVADMVILMDMTVEELLNHTVLQASMRGLDEKHTKKPLHNCLIPLEIILKRDRQTYSRMISKFIKETSSIYPGSEIAVLNDGIPGLIKIKAKTVNDIKETQFIDSKSTHLGFSFEEVRHNLVELPLKSSVHSTSQMITDFSLRPLQYKGTSEKIKFHSQFNLKRYMAFKFDNVISEDLGLNETSNCKVELKLQIGEFLLRKTNPSSDKEIQIIERLV
jgi:hypothetical protein